MIYDEKNIIEVDGNGNIILQDVNAETVTINFNQSEEIKKLISLASEELLSRIQDKISEEKNFKEIRRMLENYLSLPPDIKNVKEQIKKKVYGLIQKLQPINMNFPEKLPDYDISKFSEVDFEKILDSIKLKNCVLFIGPEISTDKDNRSLHENFYYKISKVKQQYNDVDGFFMPGSENNLVNPTQIFYNENFPNQNIKGKEILEKIAQIPFKLIIPVTPDDTISRIFSVYNMKHCFRWYVHRDNDIKSEDLLKNELYELNTEIKKLLEDKSDTSVIYNALGCAAKDGKYVFTHSQFSHYLKQMDEIRIPKKIESFLKGTATNYLFIGFNFDKWYYRLLMFALNFDHKKESFAFDEGNKTQEINKNFINAQFNVTFINKGFEEFAGLLLEKCREAGLSKPLDLRFIESITHELETVTDKTYDSSKREELRELQGAADEIEQKINNWLNYAGKN